MTMKPNEAKATSQAKLDQMWADLRQHRPDIEIIAEHGLPEPDDQGAAEHQDRLVKMMACAVAAELIVRELDGS